MKHVAFACLLLPALAGAAPAPAGPPELTTLLARSDDSFRDRANPARARDALEGYRRAVADTQRKDPQALWRLAMGCYFVGLRLTEDSDHKAQIFAEGRDAGLDSVHLAPNCPECHFWAAINMALYGDTVGPFKMLFSLKRIEELLRQSIAIDPSYAGSGAYRVLGLIQQKLPGILGGSNDRAREYFEKAIATSPDHALNYLFLAQLLRENFNQSDRARVVARIGLSRPAPASDQLEDLEALRSLKEMR